MVSKFKDPRRRGGEGTARVRERPGALRLLCGSLTQSPLSPELVSPNHLPRLERKRWRLAAPGPLPAVRMGCLPAWLLPAPQLRASQPWPLGTCCLFLPWPCGLDLCPCAHSEVPSIPPSPLSLVPTPSSDFYSFPPPPPPPRRHLISSPAPHSFPGFCALCTHRLATPPPGTAHTSPGFPPNPGD